MPDPSPSLSPLLTQIEGLLWSELVALDGKSVVCRFACGQDSYNQSPGSFRQANAEITGVQHRVWLTLYQDLGDENHVWRSRGMIKMRVGRFLADVKLPTDGDAERLARRLADILRTDSVVIDHVERPTED